MSNYIFEIQTEIIKRLPMKSLVQFRSVLKQWKSLIDSSQLIAEYQQNTRLQQHLLVRTDFFKYDCVSFLDNDTYPHQKVSITVPESVPNQIVGCSQGLFCFYDFHNAAVIWNPSIRKSVDVVVPGPFDGRFDNDNVGFGVCPRTLDPILVKIPTEYPIKNLDNTTWVVDVFRLSLGVWKSLCMDLPTWCITSTCSQVVIDKFIYWHVFERMSGYNLIISFDMISEEFTEIRLPDSLSGGNDDTDMYICKLKESLVVLQVDQTEFYGDCGVWMMDNGDPKSFENIYSIKSNIPDGSIQNVLEFNRNGEVIVVMTNEEKEHELFVYEPISQHVNHLGISAKRPSFFVGSYTGTLLLLDH
ncbi:putative F-box domain-containing protein [Tanacetum coccineum]|uniref:F-box domain-containing protein n=1 Tax=Tanacetum coccineum TaxID=301880 RepID=A0ABQ4ZBP5_9ASTR